MAVLREIATAPNQGDLNKAWKRYRDHQAKNVMWLAGPLRLQGAKSLRDFGKIHDPSSDHPAILDAIKQLGLYTDFNTKRIWKEPDEIIDEKVSKAVIAIAGYCCPKKEVSTREVELWIRHVGGRYTSQSLVAYFTAMKDEGLIKGAALKNLKAVVLGDEE